MNTKQESYVKVPVALLKDTRLSSTDIRVYGVLRSFGNEAKNQPSFPSCKKVQSLAHCSKSTVLRSIKKLCSAGWIDYKRGRTGRSNEYRFLHGSKKNAVEATELVTSVDQSCITHGHEQASRMDPQLEFNNQTNQPFGRIRLFHGDDFAFVQPNGDIRIKTHNERWVDYGGGDDDRFRFGEYTGREARMRAVAHFSNHCKLDKLQSLPTKIKSLDTSRFRQHRPLDN